MSNLKDVGNVMREAYKRRWISMRDGNISIRHEKRILITPSGVLKFSIKPQDLVILNSGVGGSIESRMHELLHSNRNIQSVVHLHPTNVVAAMHAGFDLSDMCKDFPELYRYTKVGPNVPSLAPGSPQLARQTLEAMMPTFDLVGQANHGVTAMGQSPWDAFEHIERLDHICEIVLKARSVKS